MTTIETKQFLDDIFDADEQLIFFFFSLFYDGFPLYIRDVDTQVIKMALAEKERY